MSRETPSQRSVAPCREERLREAVERFRAGEERERWFRLLHDCFYDRVRGFFRKRRLPTDRDVLDLTQEVFLRVYHGLEGFRGESQVGTWLFRIARNVHSKAFRRADPLGDAVAAPSGEDGESSSEESPWGYVTRREEALERVLAEEERRLLAEAIESLAPQQRACTVLRTYQDLKVREIAVVMGLSPETVKAHLSLARQQLRQRLRDHFDVVRTGTRGGTP